MPRVNLSWFEKDNPGTYRAAILLGDCLERLGQHDEVVNLLGPIHRSQPRDPDLEYVRVGAHAPL
jgi:hypothetical protein